MVKIQRFMPITPVRTADPTVHIGPHSGPYAIILR